MSDTFPERTSIAAAHDAQNAVSAARRRLHLLRQRVEHGDIDLACIMTDLSDTDDQLGQVSNLVGILQVGVIHAEDAAVPAVRLDD